MPAVPPLRHLPLTRSGLDRAAHLRGDRQHLAAALADPTTRVLDLYADRAPYVQEPSPRLRYRSPGPADSEAMLLGTDEHGASYLLAAHPGSDDGADVRGSARELAPLLSDFDAGLFITALGLANWHARQGFCPNCGSPTEVRDAGWTRACTGCGQTQFPRTDPAVIMAVIDDQDRLLVAQAPQWPAARMSVLAGFVEPGETFEAAVAREVHEEVGVRVTDVEYRASQPWPFPASIMVGFRARAQETELRLQREEIAAARWLRREDLPGLVDRGELVFSPRLSISRHLVEEWYGGDVPEKEGVSWR